MIELELNIKNMKLREAKNQAEDVVREIILIYSTSSMIMNSKPYYISNVPNAVKQAREQGYPIHTRTHYTNNIRGKQISFAQWYIKEEDRQKTIDKYNLNK